MKYIISILLIFVLSACQTDTIADNNSNTTNNNTTPIKTVTIKTHQDTVNYSLGVVIGSQLQSYGVDDIDYDILIKAVEDVLSNNPNNLPIHPEVAKNIVNLYVNASVNQKEITYGDLNSKFLIDNLLKQGVVELPCGMQYKIITQGQGSVPTFNDKVVVNFSGMLVDGSVFSNTYDKTPVEFMVKNSILGWQKALTTMKVGSEWVIYLPPNLAYGATGSNKVPPNSVVIYKIQLLEIL
ncbi:MAG: FKBP-type peptidyl-prolyl cis-trans isomerase [Bacteroidales bacterium]|nr:FKBP-type peptidyl-prolyl cis-trans isomerase [Bacteroidales bacterium]